MLHFTSFHFSFDARYGRVAVALVVSILCAPKTTVPVQLCAFHCSHINMMNFVELIFLPGFGACKYNRRVCEAKSIWCFHLFSKFFFWRNWSQIPPAMKTEKLIQLILSFLSRYSCFLCFLSLILVVLSLKVLVKISRYLPLSWGDVWWKWRTHIPVIFVENHSRSSKLFSFKKILTKLIIQINDLRFHSIIVWRDGISVALCFAICL